MFRLPGNVTAFRKALAALCTFVFFPLAASHAGEAAPFSRGEIKILNSKSTDPTLTVSNLAPLMCEVVIPNLPLDPSVDYNKGSKRKLLTDSLQIAVHGSFWEVPCVVSELRTSLERSETTGACTMRAYFNLSLPLSEREREKRLNAWREHFTQYAKRYGAISESLQTPDKQKLAREYFARYTPINRSGKHTIEVTFSSTVAPQLQLTSDIRLKEKVIIQDDMPMPKIPENPSLLPLAAILGGAALLIFGGIYWWRRRR